MGGEGGGGEERQQSGGEGWCGTVEKTAARLERRVLANRGSLNPVDAIHSVVYDTRSYHTAQRRFAPCRPASVQSTSPWARSLTSASTLKRKEGSASSLSLNPGRRRVAGAMGHWEDWKGQRGKRGGEGRRGGREEDGRGREDTSGWGGEKRRAERSAGERR